jgi:hypothetical protein
MVDSHVERALAARKRGVSRRFTVAGRARIAGLSRAPFARRFERAMFSFAKAFKRAYGIAPGLFRKRAWTMTTARVGASVLRAA